MSPVLALLALAGLAPAHAGELSEAFVPTVAPDPSEEAVRLVFIGDSGYIPDGQECAWREDGSVLASCMISVAERGRLLRSIRAEQAHGVYGLGDLVYPHAPGCRVPEGRDMQTLANAVGAVYADLDAPAYLVLGNHDVGHLESRDSRVQCLQAFAEGVEGVNLPAAQYSVDHGLVTVVVGNTNLRDQALWPGEAMAAALARGDWVVFAGHHELRTAFEKSDDGIWEPPGSGQWLVGLGVAPHLYANGHAHALQLGAFDARITDDGEVDADDPDEPLPVLALTSGAASKLRANPSCAPHTEDVCDTPDPRGQPAFALSRFGYAVVDLSPELMTVTLKDLDGEELFAWSRTKEDVGPVAPEALAGTSGTAGPSGADAASAGTRPLHGPRWCEPSALGILSVDGDEVVVVGDNEHEEGLLLTRRGSDGDGVLEARGVAPYLRISGDGEPEGWSLEDLEAMTPWGDGLLLVGSHSRRSLRERGGELSCPRDHRRRRAALVHLDEDLSHAHVDQRWEREAADWEVAMSSTEACVKVLFDGDPGSASDLVCGALVAAEAAAEAGDPAGCGQALDIEGAVTVEERVWLGLRAPLIDGRAVLLRLEEDWASRKRSRGLSFDAVAWVDLGGLVIRGLDTDGERLVGSAHTGGDDPSGAPFSLWTAPLDQLAPDAVLAATLAGPLPPSTEGVLVLGSDVLFVVDGDEGEGPACAVPGGSLRRPLPR